MSKKEDLESSRRFLLKFILGSTFRNWDPEKSMCQTTSKHLDVSTPYFPPAKMNYDGRTNGRTDISCFALSNVMALRAKMEIFEH